MKLFIMRHGDAPYTGTHGERALSETDIENTRQVINNRRKQLQSLGHIICSPLLRARQTMEVVVAALARPDLRITFDNCLKTEGTIESVAAFLNQCPEDDILLVSHQPLVGRMVNYLADADGVGHQMGTSCLAAFDLVTFTRGGGTLQWLDTP